MSVSRRQAKPQAGGRPTKAANTLLPVLVALVFTGLSALVAYDVRNTGGSQLSAHGEAAQGLLLLLEFGMPPVAGLVAANLVGGNPAIELHLSLPRTYAALSYLRLLLLTLYCTAVAGTELNELLSSLSTREGLALITLEDNVPAFVPEAVRKTVLTVSEAKGLDFHSLRAGCRTPHRTLHSRGWPNTRRLRH